MLNVETLSELELVLYDETKQSDSDDGDETTSKKKKALTKKFISIYKPLRMLGSGGFGVVVACQER